MPRPKSENTFQMTVKIPDEWLVTADEVAAALSKEGLTASRSDAIRAAIRRGLTELHAEHVAKKRSRRPA